MERETPETKGRNIRKALKKAGLGIGLATVITLANPSTSLAKDPTSSPSCEACPSQPVATQTQPEKQEDLVEEILILGMSGLGFTLMVTSVIIGAYTGEQTNPWLPH